MPLYYKFVILGKYYRSPTQSRPHGRLQSLARARVGQQLAPGWRLGGLRCDRRTVFPDAGNVTVEILERQLVGIIRLNGFEPNMFSVADLRILEALSLMASLALENLQLELTVPAKGHENVGGDEEEDGFHTRKNGLTTDYTDEHG